MVTFRGTGRAGQRQGKGQSSTTSAAAIEKESATKNDPGSNVDIVLAAARLLLNRNIPAAETTLLAYLPSCADDFEDDLLACS